MTTNKSEVELLYKSIVMGTDLFISVGFDTLFAPDFNLEIIESVNIIPSKGVEIIVKNGVNVNLQMIVDCIKVTNNLIPGINNIFKLLPESWVWNKFFERYQFNHIGLDISDGSSFYFNFKSLYKAGESLNNMNDQFPARTIKIYFININNNEIIFQSPSIIWRILGRIFPDYLSLILVNYKSEMLNYSLMEEGIAGSNPLPSLFNLFEFIEYYDTLEVTTNEGQDSIFKRKLFLSQIIKNEYIFLKDSIDFDVGTTNIYLSRIRIKNLESILSHQIILSFEEIINNSPEKCICVSLEDMSGVYFAIFDTDYYQLDLIDLMYYSLPFSMLINNNFNNGCKAVINGSFWDVGNHILHHAIEENLVGIAAKALGDIKGTPMGNFIFRNGTEWHPETVTISSDPNELPQNYGILNSDENRYYFYQTQSGRIKISRGHLPEGDDLNPSDKIVVGCDNLIAFINKSFTNNTKIILDVDTDDWIIPKDNFDLNNNYVVLSSNPNYSPDIGNTPKNARRGFPFFGVIEKNAKNYLYFLVAEDYGPLSSNSLSERPEKMLKLLKDIGATNVLFTDGGTSAKYIFDEKLVTTDGFLSSNKDVLISSGIGIQPKDYFDPIFVLDAYLDLGGHLNELEERIDKSLLSEGQKLQRKSSLSARKSLPFIDDSENQTITSPYGTRILNGQIDYHPGIDIRARTPLNVLINLPGIIYKAHSQNGYGNLIIVNHGKNILGYYYYTFYAHLSEYLVDEGEYVDVGQAIAVTGNTGTTIPHLHFELRIIKKALTDITYANLLNSKYRVDPTIYIIPKNLAL